MNGRGPTCALNVFSAANTDRIREFKQVQTAAEEFTAELSGRLKSVFTPEYSPESEMIFWIYKNLDQTLFAHKTTSRLVSSFKNENQKVTVTSRERGSSSCRLHGATGCRKKRKTNNKLLLFFTSPHRQSAQFLYDFPLLFVHSGSL